MYSLVRQAMRRDSLRRKGEALKLRIKASKSSLYQKELQSRKRVLRRWGFIDKDDVLLPKGKASKSPHLLRSRGSRSAPRSGAAVPAVARSATRNTVRRNAM